MRKSIIASLRGGNLGIFGMGGVRPQDGPGPAPSARPWPVLRAGYSGRYIHKMGEGYVVGIGYVQRVCSGY